MSVEVDVRVRRGEARIACAFHADAGITVLFGPSGAGKTSVLDMIAGLLRPDAGRIAVNGRVLFDAARGIALPVWERGAGYVFQDPRLLPHMTVRANLRYGDPGGAYPERYGAFERLTQVLGIAHLLDRWPRTLSGGEARRVAIGRALLCNPDFLLDEHLSSLDRARREEIMALIERLRDGLGLPMLLVTHDAGEAERLGNRVVEI